MSVLSQKRQWLAERPYVLAIIITIGLILWMASGAMHAQETPAAHQKQIAPIAKVQVQNMTAQLIHDTVELYGRTEPNRITTLRAEIHGKITEVIATRGAKVSKNQIIAKIALNDLPIQLERTQALVEQRKIEYKGAKSLNNSGFQGEAQLAQAYTALIAAKSELAKLKVSLDNTVIRAPFSGILNDRYVEVGDYVKSGDKIALIADLNPLIVRAYVTENQVNKLSVNQSADVRLLNKGHLQGRIRYIASVGDNVTNTFKIEVNIKNDKNKMPAGISSDINIPLAQVSAIKLSPALLSLDEQGNIGVKSVVNNKVVFTPINIIKTEPDGIWLTGLGENAEIIVLGQGFVRDGDEVETLIAPTTSSLVQGE